MPFFEAHNSGVAFSQTSAHHSRNMSFPLHMHASFEAIFVEEGAVTVRIEGDDYTAVAGDAVLVPPNAVHSYKTPEHSLCDVIIFNPEYLSEIRDEMKAGLYRNPVLRGYGHMVAAIREAREEPFLFRARLYELAAVYAKGERIGGAQARENSFTPALCAYLEAHYREPLCEEQMARALGYHPRYLSLLIKKSFGIPFRRLLNELRIKNALPLLSRGDMSITEIYLAVGFDSQTTFNRNFKEQMGMTPLAYKRGLWRSAHGMSPSRQ